MNKEFAFDYNDIRLIPKFSVVESRQDCNTNQKFGLFDFKLPVIPANMKSVINKDICKFLAKNGYFYVMHRFDINQLEFISDMKSEGLYSSISLGVQEYDLLTVDRLLQTNLIPDFITIDIAHGHSFLMKRMVEYIKFKFGNKLPYIIAGNVGTPEGVKFLEELGVHAAKIGIGPGKVCTTSNKTGFGTNGWQLGSLKWCSENSKIAIIADGGIRNNGDIAKSLVCGADFVMVGSLFAGLEDSPGKIINQTDENGNIVKYKEYFGSASEYNKSIIKNIEGKKLLEPINGTFESKLKEITEDLQSSISYAGGKDLSAFNYVDYIKI